jgi:alpha-L-fucosidase 2
LSYPKEYLPALPDDWVDGKITGLYAKGGFVINMKWETGKLVHVRIYSREGGKCLVKYHDQKAVLETKKEIEYFPFKL